MSDIESVNNNTTRMKEATKNRINLTVVARL